MKLQAYLAFNGNCLEALHFYGAILNAKIQDKITYKDKKIDVPNSYREKLQHAVLKGKGVYIMAYDAAPDTPLSYGNNIHLSVDVDDKDQAATLFHKLQEQGTVHHKFREREWGYFGRCTDKFGINWMVNCNC